MKSGPLDHFDRIVCINLDERPDRWQQMQTTVAPLLGQAKLERFAAVKPDIALHPVHNARAGCLLSHRRVIQAAYRDQLESVLVFEDDVYFDPQLQDSLPRSLATLGTIEWDFFYLGLTSRAPLLHAGEGLTKTLGGVTTHAVAYHRRAMPYLLERLPEEKDVLRFLSRYKAIDHYYAKHLGPRMRCYTARPLLAFQRGDYSDIQQKKTVSNEQAARQAFEQHMLEEVTRVTRLKVMAGLALRRVRSTVDSFRRRMLRPAKAKPHTKAKLKTVS